jgi:KaiC/GvpD/RAD55 family RecA-like ATPase
MSILSLHKKETVVERRSTGIPGLDELLSGGFPNHCGILMRGPPGCGKSLFCKQILWEGLKKGEFGLYISIDHPPNEIRQSMATFGWDVTPYEKKGMFVIIDCFNGTFGIQGDEKYYVKNPLDLNEQMYVIDMCVKDIVNIRGPDINVRVAYDSAPLSSMRDLPTFFRIARRLISYAKTYNCVGISPMHKGAQPKIVENALLQVADGIIELDKRIENNKLNYYLLIDKMMMTPHSRKIYPYLIADDGIHVIKSEANTQ